MSTYLTAPLLLMGGASLKAAGDLQALEKGFAATYKGAGDMATELKKVQDVAKLPGLGLKEAIQGATNLQAVGFAADQARDILTGFGNALATVGKGKADLDGVVTALSQMAAKGKISAEEINQMAERVPQIRKVMQSAFGTADTEQLQKMGISVEQFVSKVTGELNKLPKVTGGINNAFENMADAGFLALSKIGDAINKSFDIEGKLNAIGDALSKAAEGFGNLDPSIQKTIFVVAGLAAAAGPLLLAFGAISSAIPTLVAGFALISGPVGLIVAGLAAVTVAGVAFARSFGSTTQASNSATDAFRKQKDASDQLANSLTPLLARYEELKSKTTLNKDEQRELSEIIQKVGKVIPGAVSAYDKLGNAIGLNTAAAKEFIATQQKITELKNTAALSEQRKNYADLEKQIRLTSKQIEGANRFLNAPNPGNDQYIEQQKKRRAEELYALNEQKKSLLEQRKAIGGYIDELKGIPPVFKAGGDAGAESTAKVNALIQRQIDLLNIQKEKIAGATDEKSLAIANARAAAIQVEIDRLQSLGVANTQMQDALKELNKELYLNGQYSMALGNSYGFIDERRGVLESGIKKLIDAGFGPMSKAVQSLKAELNTLPSAIDTITPSFANTIPTWSTFLENFAAHGKFVVNDLKKAFAALNAEVKGFDPEKKYNNKQKDGTNKYEKLQTNQTDVVLSEARKKADAFAASMRQTGEALSTALQGVATEGLVMLGQTMGDLFSGNFQGIEAFFRGFTSIVADFMSQFGQQLIALGIGKLALDNLFKSGWGAIAAGVALVALGGAVKSINSKGTSGMGAAGGRSTAPTYRSPAANTSFQGANANAGGAVEFKIRGQELVGVLRTTGYNAKRTG